MRKFNLYDKVLLPNESGKTLGCIVGFETEETDGVIVSVRDGKISIVKEHLYVVVEGEANTKGTKGKPFLDIRVECFESEIQPA